MRLRVIAGTHGGRLFESPESFTTHPMSERMRGALFNMLGDLSGKRVLDAFAGSGALSFEAASRGAEFVIAIERDRHAQKIIAKNIDSLKLSQKIQLIRGNCGSWSKRTEEPPFDLILCDPPYSTMNMQFAAISSLISHLKPNGLMVLSLPGRESAPTVNGVVVVDKRKYGDAALAIYRSEAAK